ncbi:MAG: outer membrane beta-barrel protein [Gemmatimonadaceae bacterium]
MVFTPWEQAISIRRRASVVVPLLLVAGSHARAQARQGDADTVHTVMAGLLDRMHHANGRMWISAGTGMRRLRAEFVPLVPASPRDAPMASPGKDAPPALTWGGSADLYFSANGNHPATGRNALRAFDVVAGHGIRDGLVDLWVQRARRPIGFRLDVNAGETARLVNAMEPSHAKAWRYLQQAFVSVNLAKDGSTYLDIGKWVTPAGAELIEPADNWLSSRGLLFTWAIPFYHAGARITHSLNATDYVALHVNRGWNAVGNPRHGVGFGASAAKAVNDHWTVSANYLGGEEAAVTGGTEMQHLLDIVALFNASARWSFTFNADIARQASAGWHGISVQAKRALGASAVTARGELLSDVNGKLLGTPGAQMASFTLGQSIPWGPHFVSRIEVRQDAADRSVLAAQGVGGPRQSTLLASFIVKF